MQLTEDDYRNPKCWAAPLGGCSEKISREHLVSQCLFPSGEITVRGFSWCREEPKTVGLASLTGKILCKTHNTELSELDDTALEAFEAFRESVRINDFRAPYGRTRWTVKRFKVNGRLLERWFLKTLINLSYRGEWIIGSGSHEVGRPSDELVQAAFGKAELPYGAGLYVVGQAGERINSMDRLNLTPQTDGPNLVAGLFIFRGYRFFLNLTPQKFERHADLSSCIATQK